MEYEFTDEDTLGDRRPEAGLIVHSDRGSQYASKAYRGLLKGCLSRDGMLHMIFKLGECAQKNWRRQRGFYYLAKVVQGVKFKDGEEVVTDNQMTVASND